MKKLLSFALVVAVVLSLTSGAFAMNFTGELGNDATFETLQEARVNAPGSVGAIVENDVSTFVSHPVLDGYPEGTTYIYRSANLYGGRAAGRLNTNIIVYADHRFASKDDALTYLKDAGLTDLIDEAIGSVILVSPIDEVAGYGIADAKAYYALQTAMLAVKESMTISETEIVTFAEAEYFGGFGYLYFIGIESGATFFNNYIMTELDFAGRLAGALLIGGGMQKSRDMSIGVPVYLVNVREDIADKHRFVNGTNAKRIEKTKTTYYNQAQPVMRVIETTVADIDIKALITDAYEVLFSRVMRIPSGISGLNSVGSPYSGYALDQSPYGLFERNPVKNGVTPDGVHVISHQGDDDRFANLKTESGAYLDVWYEYLPEEVLNGSAPDGSIPLILGNHGGGDDARVFVDEYGLLKLAGEERIAIVAADNQDLFFSSQWGPSLEALVNYMLEKYPALDASRVYAIGYSMGGFATFVVGGYAPSLFAAIAPAAGILPPTEDAIAKFTDTELPMLFQISSHDRYWPFVPDPDGHLNEDHMNMLTFWAGVNGIEPKQYDFEAYPIIGFEADIDVIETVNDQYETETWYMCDDKGEPRVGFSIIKGMNHALYPGYGAIAWDFLKHYSRNVETLEIVYNPYVH